MCVCVCVCVCVCAIPLFTVMQCVFLILQNPWKLLISHGVEQTFESKQNETFQQCKQLIN